MSNRPDNMSASDGEPASRKLSTPDDHSGSATVSVSEAWGALRMDDAAAGGGLTSLSHSPAHQGRRSLFRR
jgi:hypothetical protein